MTNSLNLTALVLEAKKLTAYLQYEQIQGMYQRIGVARLALSANKVVELFFQVDTSGHYRKTLVTGNITAIVDYLRKPKALPEPELVEVATTVNEKTGGKLPATFFDTSIPLAEIMVSVIGIGAVITCIESLYENHSPIGSYCNVLRPPRQFIKHTRKFHPEFLIPTTAFPQEFFLENIQKKSNLSEIEIFEDFVYYHQTFYQRLVFISSVCMRTVLIPVCSVCVEYAIDMLFSELKRNHEVFAAVIQFTLSVAIASSVGKKAKELIKLFLLGVMMFFHFITKVIQGILLAIKMLLNFIKQIIGRILLRIIMFFHFIKKLITRGGNNDVQTDGEVLA